MAFVPGQQEFWLPSWFTLNRPTSPMYMYSLGSSGLSGSTRVALNSNTSFPETEKSKSIGFCSEACPKIASGSSTVRPVFEKLLERLPGTSIGPTSSAALITVQAKENSPVFLIPFVKLMAFVQFLIVFNPVCCVQRIGYGKSGNVCAQAPSSLGQDHLINSLYKIERGFFEFRIDRCNSELLREISKVDKVREIWPAIAVQRNNEWPQHESWHLFSSCLAV